MNRCNNHVLSMSVAAAVAAVVVVAAEPATTKALQRAPVSFVTRPHTTVRRTAMGPRVARQEATHCLSTETTNSKLGMFSDDSELGNNLDDGSIEDSGGGQDLMDAFLAEAAQRLASSPSTAAETPEELQQLQNRRSMEFVSPASIGGWKPQTPSFLLSSDYVVQHLMEGLANLAPRDKDDSEGEYDESQYEEDEKEALRQCFLFTSLDSDAGKWDANFRVSWGLPQNVNNRDRYERVLLHGPKEFIRDLKRHFPFLISGQWQDFSLLGIPQFNSDETECSVHVRIMPQGRLYRFLLSRPELLQAERVTHQDCWLVSNVEELSAAQYGGGGGSCSI